MRKKTGRKRTHGHRWMESAMERGAAPLALPSRVVIVTASAVGAVVLMIAI